MLIIGEPLSISICDSLPRNTMVTNLYGPTKCTTCSKAQVVDKASLKRISIGTGLCLNTCLEEPSNDSKLVLRCSTRELLLKVPLNVASYLSKAATITAVFVNNLAGFSKNPQMLALKVVAPDSNKIGDLIRYNIDGSLEFLGRRTLRSS